VDDLLTIGEVAERTGVAPSALRYYEDRGLLAAVRTEGNQRRYPRAVLRRVAVIRTAQQLGRSLDEIADALAPLPQDAAPTAAQWADVATAWATRLDEQIAALVALRDQLDRCIGCGCLSLTDCWIRNPGDRVGAEGPGPRLLPPVPSTR